MENKPNNFNIEVIKSILATNQFGITDVIELEGIKSLNFDYDKYPQVRELVKKGNLELINTLSSVDDKPALYLEIMRLTDQNRNHYIVTVFDSDELWQDPQVIEIFPLSI